MRYVTVNYTRNIRLVLFTSRQETQAGEEVEETRVEDGNYKADTEGYG